MTEIMGPRITRFFAALFEAIGMFAIELVIRVVVGVVTIAVIVGVGILVIKYMPLDILLILVVIGLVASVGASLLYGGYETEGQALDRLNRDLDRRRREEARRQYEAKILDAAATAEWQTQANYTTSQR